MKKISFRQFKIIVSIVSLRIQIPCDVHAEDFSSEYQIP